MEFTKIEKGGKNIYTLKIDEKIKTVKLLLNLKSEIKDVTPSFVIKYQIIEGEEIEENSFKFNKELKISSDKDGIKIAFDGIIPEDDSKIDKNNLEIEYTVYLYDKIENIENIHPSFLREKEYINITNILTKGTDTNKLSTDFIYDFKEGKEYCIVILAVVKYENNEVEYVYSKQFKFNLEEKVNNDKIFYFIMGSFAFIVIFVFIVIFCIINKRKANNPDIDDEEYSNIKIYSEAINEDEN